jgi:hypothetical protein
MPVPRNEFLHPRRVIATKYSVFGAPHHEPVDLDNLIVTDSFLVSAEIRKREVGSLRINGELSPDPNGQIWR